MFENVLFHDPRQVVPIIGVVAGLPSRWEPEVLPLGLGTVVAGSQELGQPSCFISDLDPPEVLPLRLQHRMLIFAVHQEPLTS